MNIFGISIDINLFATIVLAILLSKLVGAWFTSKNIFTILQAIDNTSWHANNHKKELLEVLREVKGGTMRVAEYTEDNNRRLREIEANTRKTKFKEL